MKLLLLLLLVVSSAQAAKVDLKNLPANTKRGMEMFKIGKVEEAKKLLKPEADAGNAAAQFFLALSLDGNTPAAQAAALTYYKKSSDQGFPAAQMIYGTFLLNGPWGVPKKILRRLRSSLRPSSQTLIRPSFLKLSTGPSKCLELLSNSPLLPISLS